MQRYFLQIQLFFALLTEIWAQKYRSKATHPVTPCGKTPYGHLKNGALRLEV
jgi:hypothetical protein